MIFALFNSCITVPSLGATLHCNYFFSLNNMHKTKRVICLGTSGALNPLSSSADGQAINLYLNPIIGHSLQMLHFAWCLAVSAAATLCRTGSHTMDWGSSRIQSRNRAASISGLLLACNTGGRKTGAEHG